jgi:hypothetical protein
VHTFLRVPAGAVLAATAVGDVSMAAQVAAAIVGGSLAAATHASKAGTRVMVNTSPEPVSNWSLSIAEDLAVFAGLWTALNYPNLFLALLVAFIVLTIWLLPKIWRGVRVLYRKLAGWLGAAVEPDPAPGGAAAPASSSDPGLRFSLSAPPPKGASDEPPAT